MRRLQHRVPDRLRILHVALERPLVLSALKAANVDQRQASPLAHPLPPERVPQPRGPASSWRPRTPSAHRAGDGKCGIGRSWSRCSRCDKVPVRSRPESVRVKVLIGDWLHARRFLQVLRNARELFDQGGEHVLRALNLFDEAWLQIERAHAWASEHSRNARPAAELCRDLSQAGTYLLDLRQHPLDQIRWLETGIDAARNLGDSAAESEHLNCLGLVLIDTGRSREAIPLFERAAAIARAIKKRGTEGNALGNLGLAYSDLGDVAVALEYSEQWLEICRQIGDRVNEANALNSVANCHYRLGALDRAAEGYEQDLAICRELGLLRGEAKSLQNLGNVYDKRGELKRALKSYHASRRLARLLGDPPFAGTQTERYRLLPGYRL